MRSKTAPGREACRRRPAPPGRAGSGAPARSRPGRRGCAPAAASSRSWAPCGVRRPRRSARRRRRRPVRSARSPGCRPPRRPPAAPWPSVSSSTACLASSPRTSTISVAPNRRPSACRAGLRLSRITRSAFRSSTAPSTAHSPTAPSPTTTAVPAFGDAGHDRAVQTGGHHVGGGEQVEQPGVVVRVDAAGDHHEVGVGVRHPQGGALGAVVVAAAPGAGVRARGGQALETPPAGAASVAERRHDEVARRDGLTAQPISSTVPMNSWPRRDRGSRLKVSR